MALNWNLRLVRAPGAKQCVDRSLPGNFRNEIRPSPCERAVMNFDTVAARSEYAEIATAFNLESHVIQVFGGYCQRDVNLEATIGNDAIHEALLEVNHAPLYGVVR